MICMLILLGTLPGIELQPDLFGQGAFDLGEDVGQGFVKSVVFALVVTWIALFNGYDAKPTSAGISQATTRTVVHSSLAVLGLDFLLTAVMFG